MVPGINADHKHRLRVGVDCCVLRCLVRNRETQTWHMLLSCDRWEVNCHFITGAGRRIKYALLPVLQEQNTLYNCKTYDRITYRNQKYPKTMKKSFWKWLYSWNPNCTTSFSEVMSQMYWGPYVTSVQNKTRYRNYVLKTQNTKYYELNHTDICIFITFSE